MPDILVIFLAVILIALIVGACALGALLFNTRYSLKPKETTVVLVVALIVLGAVAANIFLIHMLVTGAGN